MVSEIEICVEGEIIRLNARVDSGNLAREPMSGKPVILVKKGAVEKYYKLWGENMLENHSGIIAKRLRIIPIKGIGGDKILMGIRADYVTVILKEGRARHDAVIAIDEEGGDYAGYEALVPESLCLA